MGGGGSFSIQASIAWIHFLREFSFTSEYLVVKQHLVDIHISFRIKHRSDKEIDAFFQATNSLELQFQNASSKIQCRGERTERNWLLQGDIVHKKILVLHVSAGFPERCLWANLPFPWHPIQSLRLNLSCCHWDPKVCGGVFLCDSILSGGQMQKWK